LAEWRGVDWSPLERAHQLAARATAQLVPAVVEKLGLERRRAETEIVRAWKTLIDPTLTAHAQPTGLRQGTLFVSVDSSVWLTEIVRYRQREILERLRSSFGPSLIKRISFRVG
jgi:predicted nucleic acid-binding Zn ribbon protein